jgi:cytokinin dehydrogenase
MGQCALIVGARLRVMRAPAWVVRRNLFYDDLPTFLADLRLVATTGQVDHLGALVVSRGPGNGWKFTMNVGKFSATPDVDFAPTEAGLRFASRGDPAAVTYANYLHREDARNEALYAARRETPRRMLYLTMFVPGSAAEEFLGRILATPGGTAGITRFSLYMLPMHRFNRPMFMLPREELACAIFLFRNVPVAEEARYLEMVATVRKLDLEMREAGGKAYPPYAPFYSSADWEMHYGSAWRRLDAGKRQFDPGNVLTPEMRS